MGVNAIRTAHNPPAPELLDITDRLGVLVLDEAFDTWEQTKTTNDYGLYFKDWAQRDIQTMVKRDRNHPSVVLWSIGNEVGGSTIATATNLKNWVLALDTTRAITWASNKMGGAHVGEGDDRNVAKLLDVAGYNYAPYAGDYDADHSANPTWKILGTETWTAGATVAVYVYNNCDSVELFLNDASQGSKTMSGGAVRLEWSVPWVSGTLRADCKVGGSVVASDLMKTASAAAKVALSADRPTINADGRDLVFLTADIQDGNGVLVPNAESSVSFAVSGPGQLVGVDNGNPVDTGSYKGTSRKAFSGKVLAIVRSTGTTGTITVNATSSGLTAGSVTVTAR